MRSKSFVVLCVLGAFPMLLGAGEGGCGEPREIGENDPVCGDGVVDEGEACDGSDLAGTDCIDQGFTGGSLTCADDCTFDTTGCDSEDCTDGETADCLCFDGDEGTRTCDGGAWGACVCAAGECTPGEVDSCSCADGTNGSRTCGADALWGECLCDPIECTDGETVACACEDGSSGTQTCADGAWGECDCAAGECTPGETSSCACEDGSSGSSLCGDDGRWGACECTPLECEPGAVRTCACEDGSMGSSPCGDDGVWGECECLGVCGDGVVSGDEQCDLSELAGQSCEALGYVSGDLACTDTCSFDVTDCVPGECIPGDSMECLCPDGGLGSQLCDLGHWTACVCEGECGNGLIEPGEECEGGDLDGESCLGQGFTGGDLSCADTCLFDTSACTGGASVCGDGVCDAGETIDTCPVDCMTGLPVEGEPCAEAGDEWLCAPGFFCQAVTDVDGTTTRFCYLEGCSSAADCADSIIEDSPVAMPDFITGARTQCMTMTNPAGICVGDSMPFFIEEGTHASDAPIPGPTDDAMCIPCGPLSMVLPNQYFDADPWDSWPFTSDELYCRRHCVEDDDCGMGRCLPLAELTTDSYACIVITEGFCCLPGDTAPGCL